MILFLDGNSANKFSIDFEEGNILIAGSLDWEEETLYNLTIQVSDGANAITTGVSWFDSYNDILFQIAVPLYMKELYHW